jgi:hypothetical protein
VISLSQRSLPDKTQHSQEKDSHAPSGIQTHNPSKHVAAGPHLRLHGRQDQLIKHRLIKLFMFNTSRLRLQYVKIAV